MSYQFAFNHFWISLGIVSRACGNIFCNGCTRHRLPLPYLGYKTPERVCDRCFVSVSRYLSGENVGLCFILVSMNILISFLKSLQKELKVVYWLIVLSTVHILML